MDMLFVRLLSDRTTSWNALSTSREHKDPSPLTLRADTLLFPKKTPRLCQSPFLPFPDCKTSKAVRSNVPGSGCSQRSISAVGLHPPVSVCPWTRVRFNTEMMPAWGQHPPCGAPGLENEGGGEERREPFLCRNLSYSLRVSLVSGQNLAHYGVITTACYFPLYSP